MKISKNWISEFIKTPAANVLESELTQLGLEVDTIKKIKNDYVFNIEFTPNRGDCLSVLGTSRDLAAYKNTKIKLPLISPFTIDKKNNFIKKVSAEICSEYRFMKLSMKNMIIKTPKYISDRLVKSDIALVNIIVDISNYVMLELGQPTHVFDSDKINGRLSITRCNKDSSFVGINNKEYIVDKGTPVIIDDMGIVHALPGVIGAKVSSVNSDTRNILFESAFFIPDTIRALSRKYRIQTDSSYRFERGVDYRLQETALARIHYLINQISSISDCKLTKISNNSSLTKSKTFKYDPSIFKRILGIKISQSEIKSILCNLGFVINSTKITIPSHRFDISSNYDLVEEVSRMIGYDSFPDHPLDPSVNLKKNRHQFNDQLVTLGYKEVINFTFISKNYSSDENNLIIENPISKDKSVMRDSLIPGVLKNIAYNSNRQHKSIQIFETGKVYTKVKNKILETNKMCGSLFGLKSPSDLVSNQYEFGIDDLKSDILSFLPGCEFVKHNKSDYFDNKNSLKILLLNREVGECGLISSACVNEFELKKNAFAFEINLDAIIKISTLTYAEISQFPAVYKDITIITNMDDDISFIISELHKSSYKYK